MKTITATEFKARCLEIMDNLDAEGITVTKRGKPVALLLPARRHPSEFIGILPDIIVDPDDDLFSTGAVWEAELPVDSAAQAAFVAERKKMGYSPRAHRK